MCVLCRSLTHLHETHKLLLQVGAFCLLVLILNRYKMEHYHEFQKGITYFHTTNGHLIPIKSESLSELGDKKEFTDIYGNEIILDKNEIDIAFSDKGIYHNFHNENFFKSNKNYFKFLGL